jgi:DtxR family Mn-dependent transcriptional regulator
MTTSNVEEYLEAIYSFEEEHKPATTTEMANRLKVSAPSVTEMLQRLAKEGYVEYEPYKSVKLTNEGRKVAKKIIRKHRLIEVFLHNLLSIRKDRVHKEACKMEHVLSDEAENGLYRILGQPNKCPDGKPIPIYDKDEKDHVTHKPLTNNTDVRPKVLLSLCSLRPGQKANVRFIDGGRIAVKRLHDLGVTTGNQIELKNCAPLGGPVEILVRGSRLAIGRGLASKIFVEVA